MVYSFQAYCHWVAEESAVSEDELSRLCPLIIALCQIELSGVKFDVWNSCLELLTAITSESVVLEIFIENGGDIVVVQRFLNNEKNRSEILDSVILNIIASKGVTSYQFLEGRFEYYHGLIPIFLEFMKRGTFGLIVDVLHDSFNALICFLLLYRSSPKYTTSPIPLERVTEILGNRYKPNFPEYLIDFFELILLSNIDFNRSFDRLPSQRFRQEY